MLLAGLTVLIDEQGSWTQLVSGAAIADMLFGGTVGWMMAFGMLPKKPAWETYVGRLEERPARVRAKEINAKIAAEKGL